MSYIIDFFANFKDNKVDRKSIVDVITGVVSSAIWSLLAVLYREANLFWIFVLLILISIVFTFYKFISRFLYYRSIVIYLRDNKDPMSTISLYLAEKKNKKEQNNFEIREMNITYKISIPDNFEEDDFENELNIDYSNRADLTILYEAKCNSQSEELKSIFFKLIVSKKGKYYLESPMFNYKVLQLKGAEDTKLLDNPRGKSYAYRGVFNDSIPRNHDFNFCVTFSQKGGFNLKQPNTLLVDPLNYSKDVKKINLSVEHSKNISFDDYGVKLLYNQNTDRVDTRFDDYPEESGFVKNKSIDNPRGVYMVRFNYTPN